ncbi:MAG TPA: ABC transporter permease [Candidatus Blautia faecavium]|uniref:ABC transporter permease n=1 Tax=Candidatus Blautia faecavium TaxID=2838487 RepID=A0A9D2LPP6_9FIRM|nr:ABC transporter permease [Candidatus Blautia faecavium]
MWNAILSPDFFSSILRSATPILFATLAAGIAAKSGITNMALEGILLFSALFGVIFSSLTQSAWLGLLITMIVGGLIGLILAFFVLNLKTDEILAAIAINLAATGGTVLIMLYFSGDRGVSSSIRSFATPSVTIPVIDKIPFIGEILSGQNALTWLALLAVIVMHLFLYKTPLGLSIRAVGENKNAAESVGISSRKIQYIALIISGVLAAMGGFYLSGGYMNMFTKDMSGGRGYIALAASSMGGDTPVGGFLVSLLFGAAQALANIMQLTSVMPYEIILMVPYLTTLVGLGIYYYSRKKKRERLSGK